MAKLGQHFLIRKEAVTKIISALDLGRGEVVLEIGPGHGELSLPLVEGAARIGAKPILIEKDPELASKLKLGGVEHGYELIQGDALEELPKIVSDLKKYKIAGNLPYYISGYFFRTISELKNKPVRTVVMIQKEVGERLCARPPQMNRLAASVQYWGKPKIIMNLKPSDFRPAPKVDSVIVSIDILGKGWGVKEGEYYRAVRALFQQPRKSVLNNIAQNNKKLTKVFLAEKIISLGLSPSARPQNMDIADICKISGLIES